MHTSRPTRTRRTRERSPGIAARLAIVLGCLAALTAIVLTTWGGAADESRDAQTETSGAFAVDGDVDAGPLESTQEGSRRVYRYSVIPGGVHSAQELREALDRDPVVAEHYRALAPDRLRIETLTRPRSAYVSYRIGDTVYWTKHKVTLSAGEQILTDGATEIRARCGNCVSDEPRLPTSDQEPEAIEFEALAPAFPELPSRGSAPGLPTAALRRDSRLPDVVPLAAPGVSAPIGGYRAPASASDPGAPTSSGNRLTQLVPRFGAGPLSNPGPPGAPASDHSVPGAGTPDAAPVPPPLIDGSLPPGVFPEDPLAGPPAPGGSTFAPPVPLVGPFEPTPQLQDWGHNEPIQPVPVPEPSTMLLFGTGAAAGLWRHLRSKRDRSRRP